MMHISIEWHGKQFNVLLSSQEGRDAFLTIKGCRIASGKNGDFVSWPSTKNENTGKWWNHVCASEKFADTVLALAQKTQKSKPSETDEDEVFF